jgi:Arc/MetJ family transcription regulator
MALYMDVDHSIPVADTGAVGRVRLMTTNVDGETDVGRLDEEVYDRCMSRTRTNIEIDDAYVARVMERYGLRTKTEAVDYALRKAAWLPMTIEEARAMEGANAIDAVPADQPVTEG